MKISHPPLVEYSLVISEPVIVNSPISFDESSLSSSKKISHPPLVEYSLVISEPVIVNSPISFDESSLSSSKKISHPPLSSDSDSPRSHALLTRNSPLDC